MKRILQSTLIITIVLLLIMPSSLYAETGSPSAEIEVSKENLKAGDNFDVTVNLNNFEDINSVQLLLNYDKTVLEPLSNKAEIVGVLKEYTESSDYIQAINKVEDGKIQFAFSLKNDTEPFSGSDKLIKIPFKVLTEKSFSISFNDPQTIFTSSKNPVTELDGVQLLSYSYTLNNGGGNTGGNGGSTPPPTPTTPTPPSNESEGKDNEVIVGAETEVYKTVEGTDIAKVKYDKASLKDKINTLSKDQDTLVFSSDQSVDVQELSFTGDILEVVQNKKKNINIKFDTPLASYNIPTNALGLDRFYKELKVNQVKDISLTINVEKSTSTIKNSNVTPLGDVVDFKVYLSSGQGVTELKTFKGYVTHKMKSNNNVSIAAKTVKTAVRVNADGTVSGVPTYLDGETATVYTNAPGSLALVSHVKTFSDIKGTWNEATIEKLASKFVINGTTETTFTPGNSVTRGQLTALLTRSLGLVASSEYDNRFKDVDGDEWYASELTAAVDAGIIGGFEDGTFRSGQTVTRQQAAAMIARALDFVGYQVDAPSVDLAEKYADVGAMSESAKDSIQTVVDAGIFKGTGNKFDPQGDTRRDQMATILDRFLTLIKFTN